MNYNLPTTTTTNCTIPYGPGQGYAQWPTYVYQTTEPTFDCKIRKIENGFICVHAGVEYCFNTPEALAKFLIKTLAAA